MHAGMDGSVLLSSLDGSTTVSCGKHKKYVVRTTWSSCGRFLASASYDKTIHLYAVEGVAEGGVRTLHTLQLVGAPEAIAFGQDDEGHVQLFAGVRDDHRIHKIDVESGHATYINMNLLGDEFVSFTAMDLAVHQRTGRLAVATDKDRVLVISLATNHIVMMFWNCCLKMVLLLFYSHCAADDVVWRKQRWIQQPAMLLASERVVPLRYLTGVYDSCGLAEVMC